MSLTNAHKLFIEETGKDISCSKFCELRPKHVKLFDSIPRNVCVCSYHENVRLLILTLKDVTNIIDSLSEYTESIVCDTRSKECMSQNCQQCQDKIDTLTPLTEDMPITYQQ